MTMTHQNIVNHLRRFSTYREPIKSDYLMKEFGVSRRELASIVREINRDSRKRKLGYMLGSKSNGYFFVRTMEEADHAINFMRGRGLNTINCAREMEDLKDSIFNPPETNLFGEIVQ